MTYSPSSDTHETNSERETVSGTISRLRLHSRGFLDQSDLIAALGIDAPESGADRDAHIARIASKLRRAATMLDPRDRS